MSNSNSYLSKPRAREIEQQLAQLRWRRMQNERNIRNYLEATKVMKQKDTILGLTIDQSAERIEWLDSVVRDELMRPLVLSDKELHDVQFEENRTKKRLSKVRQNINILKSYAPSCNFIIFICRTFFSTQSNN